MKHLLFLLFLILNFNAFCQEDKNVAIKNYHFNLYSDSISEINIYPNTKFLFSDSVTKFLDSYDNPIYSIQKNKKFSSLQITNLNFNKRKSFLTEVNESQTLLFYSLGSGNIQILDINHLQRISKKIHGQIQYKKIKVDGFYQNQKMQNDFVDINFVISNGTKKYLLLPYFKYTAKDIQENGGIKSDSLFKTGDFINSMTLETKLSEAFNNWEIIDGGIDQLVRLDKFVIKDNISFRYQERKYSDNPNQNFYDSIYLDTISTNDKFSTSGFHHDISISKIKKNISLFFELESDLLEYENRTIDTNHFQNKLNINIIKLFNNHSIYLNSNYTFSGFNKNNYLINLKYNYSSNNFFRKISLASKYINYIDDIKYSMVDMNNHQWINSFNNSTLFSLESKLITNLGDLLFNHDIYTNYILINEYIIPIQINSIKKIEINYAFEIEKKKSELKFNFKFQSVYSGDEYLRVPDFILQLDYAFKIKLKAMDTKIGIKGFYFTEYYGNYYDPSLNDFYLQNEIKTGNYPFFDFYFQAKIKTVEIKFMINHFNSGFTGFNYYTTPLYPMAPRHFQFAFSWFLRD